MENNFLTAIGIVGGITIVILVIYTIWVPIYIVIVSCIEVWKMIKNRFGEI